MLRYAFRLHRWGIIGFAVTVALSCAAQGSAWATLAGRTPGERATFVHSMTVLASQLSYLLPQPYRLDTAAGYVLWRAWGTLPILVSIWALAAASGAVRGDEDRRLVDTWIAAGVSRPRLVASRLAAFSAAALVVAVAAGLGTLVGTAQSETIPIARLLGQVVALCLFTVACFALAFLLAQLPGSIRAAQGLGALALAVLYAIDSAARTVHGLDGVAWVSPYHWYEVTNVLAPGGQLDAAGASLCVVLCLAASGLAIMTFARRDLRGPLIAFGGEESKPREVEPSPLLRRPVARDLYRQRGVLLSWTLGLAAGAVFMVTIARSAVDAILGLPGIRAQLTQNGTIDPYRGYVATYWFGIALLALAGFAIHVVSGWAADDTEGVLTAELSRPRTRWSIVAERAASATVGLAVTALAGSLAALATAQAIGVGLDLPAAARATALLIPFGLTFAAVGATASVWWPRASVGLLGMLAFASYLLYTLAPYVGWPDWVANLSVFKLYGSPYLSGVSWSGLTTMLLITAAGFGAAAVLMERRELAR